MQCNECRFHKASSDYKHSNGTCHRKAPAQVVRDEEQQFWVAVWPEVPFDEWCGDFEAVERRTTTPEEVRSSAPPEVKPEPKAEPKPPEKPLPPAKEAVVMIQEYLETAVEDFSSDYLIIQSQKRELRPSGMVWHIEARYDDNTDYLFIVGPDGIVEMS